MERERREAKPINEQEEKEKDMAYASEHNTSENTPSVFSSVVWGYVRITKSKVFIQTGNRMGGKENEKEIKSRLK